MPRIWTVLLAALGLGLLALAGPSRAQTTNLPRRRGPASGPQAEAVALRAFVLPTAVAIPPAGQTAATVRDVPAMVASRIASGDTAGAADQLFRVFQNEWGGSTTIATIQELNRMVVEAGCAPLVRDALAETYRRALSRGVQVSIPSALRAVDADIAPLAVCLVDAIAASEHTG